MKDANPLEPGYSLTSCCSAMPVSPDVHSRDENERTSVFNSFAFGENRFSPRASLHGYSTLAYQTKRAKMNR
jgi:hypothetical protein